MIITSLSSSSYNCYEMCPLQYFINYNLGIRQQVGKGAKKGTITHKILEILAKIKLADQNQQKVYIDAEFGEFSSDTNLIKIPAIINAVYNKYIQKFSEEKWTNSDFKDCNNWIQDILQSNFNPLKREIYAVEMPFSFELSYEWARYKFDDIEGALRLTGIIDLITKVDDNTLEMIDWKTGARKDWITGEDKDYNKLKTDIQLHFYHYALSYLIPDKDYLISIYFVADGGPFTLSFDKHNIKATENTLRSRFDAIKLNTMPQPCRSWKCKKFCTFGKHSFNTIDNPYIKSITEFRDGQLGDFGEPMKICDQIILELNRKGVDKTIELYTKPEFVIGSRTK